MDSAEDIISSELGIPISDLQPVEIEPQPQPRERRLDKAWLILTNDGWRYDHFEVQRSHDLTMAHRMHEYGVRLMYSRKKPEEWWPVFSHVLWTRKVANIPEPPLRIRVAEGMEIIWPFVNIKVFEWDKAKLETNAPGILILAPLVSNVTPEDLEVYAQRLYNVVKEEEREAAGALFFIFVEERYAARKRWEVIRKLVTQMLREVGFGMDIIDEMILNTDIAQHGIQVAVKERDIEILRKLWIKKFREITPDIDAALKNVSGEVINHILDEMVEPTYTLEQARSDLGL